MSFPLLALCKALRAIPELEKLFTLSETGGLPAAVSGLSHAHKAHIIAAVCRFTGKPALILCPDESEAQRLASDVSALSGQEVCLLPARENNFYNVDAASHEWEHARLSALYRMARGTVGIVCATADAVMQRTLPPGALTRAAAAVRPGPSPGRDALIGTLTAAGYQAAHTVESPAQFSARGGILDFFPPGAQNPARLEFFGDEIDTLFSFDPETQRRVSPLAEAVVLPVGEFSPYTCEDGELPARLEALYNNLKSKKNTLPQLLETLKADLDRLEAGTPLPAPDRYMALTHPTFATALDYTRPDTIVVLSEQSRLIQRVDNTLWQYGQDVETLLGSGVVAPSQTQWLLDAAGFWGALSGRQILQFDAFTPGSHKIRPRALFGLTAKQLPSYGGSLETAIGDITHYHDSGFGVAVLCAEQGRVSRLVEILRERGLPARESDLLAELPEDGNVFVARGSLTHGMEYPEIKLAVISEGAMAKTRTSRAAGGSRAAAKQRGVRVSAYTDLKPGDLVVHDHHGVARFTGVTQIETDGVMRDYVRLAYAGTDTLYVPVTKLNLVSKYIGGGEEAPVKLNKLHTAEWQRAKSRAKSAAKDLAKGLIALYAERARRPGVAFPADDPWQGGFEDAFPYAETEDQLRCTEEIKRDMERPFPMDRLLCGDVGFGKTEVAFRAVMKCVLGGKQAAMLAPTTVLAQQHYVTALRRFDHYPVRVDVLSRFRTPAQMKETLRRVQAGHVDFVIGTHRLLQKDVKFRDLGLLIVDEEQRFGVSHKERLKEMSRQVDVLTLTATPIPRTLNMALSGIRDMSTIEEAPRDRSPVQTFVLEHDWGVVLDAIRREVGRGGQVYYLHNRVETIDRTVSRLADALPDVTVAAAHGQMPEEQLNEVMRRVTDGELSVLVCTTIIETGIDIPNVNTLIVTDADKLGLSQLHQIRGRVGRSPRHAYAYLTYKQGKVLSEAASKRLSAIREFAEFGSGFRIAMRDLEIRGAGNVLGAEQSGQMVSVGYDMYLRLLEEAVLEERGEAVTHENDCTIDLTIPAGIPEQYIESSGLRMDYYRRVAAVRDQEQAADLLDELIDRFGDVPAQTDTLVQLALLRARAGALGVTDLTQKGGRLYVKLDKPDFAVISALCALERYKGRVLFSAGSEPALTVRLPANTTPKPLAEARELVNELERLAGGQ